MTSPKTNLLAVIDKYADSTASESEHVQNLNQILLSIHQNKITFINIVEQLGDYLSNTDDTIRSRATLLLAEVLGRLPTLNMNEEAVSFIMQFFIDRLLDYATVSEVMKGLHSMFRHHNDKISESHIHTLCVSLTNDVNVQTMSQSTRKLVFEIFGNIVNNKNINTIGSASEFVLAFVQSFDGEKDPRVILLAFRLIPKLVSLQGWNRFKEEIFEVISCYFPITFNPKPDDPEPITKEMLTSSLRECMAVSSEFADAAIPFLLDKLSSNVSSTKIDALQTLVHCCQKYGVEVLQSFVSDIFTAFKNELLYGSDSEGKSEQSADEVTEECLSSLCKISALIASSSACLSIGMKPFIEHYSSELTSLTKSFSHTPESNVINTGNDLHIFKILTKSLLSIASSSALAYALLIGQTFSTSIDSLSSVIGNISRQTHLNLAEAQSFAGLLYEYFSAYISLAINSQQHKTVLEPFVTKLNSLFMLPFEETTPSSIPIAAKKSAIEGLIHCIKAELVDAAQAKYIIIKLVTLIPNKSDLTPGEQELAEKVVFGLISLASSRHLNDTIHENVLSPLFLKIRKSIESTTAENWMLRALVSISVSSNLESLQYSSSQLLDLLELSKGSPSSLAFASSILQILAQCLQPTRPSAFSVQDVLKIVSQEIIPRIISTFSAMETIADPLLIILCRIIRLGMAKQQLTEQIRLLKSYSQMICSSTPSKQLSLLYSLIIGADIQKMDFVQSDLPFRSIVNSVFQSTQNDIEPQNYAAQTLSNLINKWPLSQGELAFESFIVDKIVNEALENLKSAARNGNSSEISRSVGLVIWIIKALVMSTHHQELGLSIIRDIVQKYTMDLLIAKEVALGLGIILGDSVALSPESHAVVKVLHKQRFFAFVLPIIVECSKQQTKQFAFMCLPHLIKNVNKPTLISEIPTILPLLMTSLATEEAQILEPSLATVKMLLEEYPEVIFKEFQAIDLGNTLLQIATKSSEQGILVSLECLYRLADFASEKQHKSLKQKLIKSLEPLLDDKKRTVRKQAAKTRNKWYSLA